MHKGAFAKDVKKAAEALICLLQPFLKDFLRRGYSWI